MFKFFFSGDVKKHQTSHETIRSIYLSRSLNASASFSKAKHYYSKKQRLWRFEMKRKWMKVEAKTTNRSTERHPKAIQSNHGPTSYQIRAGLFIPLDLGGCGVRGGAISPDCYWSGTRAAFWIIAFQLDPPLSLLDALLSDWKHWYHANRIFPPTFFLRECI